MRLGEWDASTDVDCSNCQCADPVVDIAISKIFIHEEFNSTSDDLFNDIALLRLKTPANFTKWIDTVPLPMSKRLQTRNYDNITLTAAGWGKTEAGD